MSAPDLVFLCTADAQVGFGHLRRCLHLSHQLRARGLRVAFDGRLDPAARDTLCRALPDVPVLEPVEPAPLAVVDCMFDPQDPDFFDRDFLQKVAARHERVVMITSSRHAPPDLPVTAVVGHMLEPVTAPAYELHRGLEWAPVSAEAAAWRNTPREFPDPPRRVLVAFGNWHDPAGLYLALEALRHTGWAATVQVLLPPALRPYADALRAHAAGLELDLVAEVPSVFPLLCAADVLVGSYGNLTFEALTVGLPAVVVAIKPFMHSYAEVLARQGAVVNAGPVDQSDLAALARRLAGLDAATRRRLSRSGRALVDGAGLTRLADLLARYARPMANRSVAAPAANAPAPTAA
jgi:spore coat polysaccharide biosynthesis predicted glycosyltransferase SpsG